MLMVSRRNSSCTCSSLACDAFVWLGTELYNTVLVHCTRYKSAASILDSISSLLSRRTQTLASHRPPPPRLLRDEVARCRGYSRDRLFRTYSASCPITIRGKIIWLSGLVAGGKSSSIVCNIPLFLIIFAFDMDALKALKPDTPMYHYQCVGRPRAVP